MRKGWGNHPITRMWQGSELVLVEYGVTVCDVWIDRGYQDTCRQKIVELIPHLTGESIPSWLGDPEFHRSHQSNLIRKLPKRYKPMFPGVPKDLDYIWPEQQNP